ncbi:MAG: rod shape-determining protein RodA [Candidatus Vogelbacteria bacterium]|nr:rod shape-determining protein RodA [Candidatus Vogelbacteria bacterium]
MSRWWQRLPLLAAIDWYVIGSLLLISGAGLLSMNSFGSQSYFFNRQVIWLAIALAVLVLASTVDWRFLRQSEVVAGLFIVSAIGLGLVTVLGVVVKGAQSWFSLGAISLQPADFMKLVLILVLAKYFSRRHIEIAYIRHILVSGLYAFIPFVLILLQPDFGSAMIIFLIWLGMIIVSGVSKKHLLIVAGIGFGAFLMAWLFVFAPYQKARIMTFVHPLADIQGAGYNAFQSMVAVGSGQWLGKGVGYGTQSRLEFLPEYETDFIFAAFAEEWGFVGVLFLFILFGVIIWRLIDAARVGASNFETLFAVGVVIALMTHFTIHVGMNIGLLPVTGLPFPFMSYGGSHILAEFLGLGMVMGMRRYGRAAHRDDMHNEFVGPQ